ncbi:MAG: hypothetical protein NTU45_10885 [Planctomycetota bacterium]|nr:hypothetical protein [Planctomycetota bacterium]
MRRELCSGQDFAKLDEIDETVVAAKRGVLFDAGIEDGRRIGRPEPLAREVVRRVLSRRRKRNRDGADKRSTAREAGCGGEAMEFRKDSLHRSVGCRS